jgi:hypothetical protein
MRWGSSMRSIAVIFDSAIVNATRVTGLLDSVVGLASRAERLVGDCPQPGPVSFEPFREHVLFVHRSHSLVVAGHRGDRPDRTDVTGSRPGRGQITTGET